MAKSVGSDGGSPAFSSGKKTSAEATEKTHNVEFAKGGKTKMFGEQAAGDQTPGHTEKDPTSAPGEKFAEGGKDHMFGYQGSVPAKAGISSAR